MKIEDKHLPRAQEIKGLEAAYSPHEATAEVGIPSGGCLWETMQHGIIQVSIFVRVEAWVLILDLQLASFPSPLSPYRLNILGLQVATRDNLCAFESQFKEFLFQIT